MPHIEENLPLKLLKRHEGELNLNKPLMVEGEAALFASYPSPVESAVVFLPKSKALINMTLALVSSLVKEDGVIVLAGTNNAGIRSANSAYETQIGPVEQKMVGNHSALYVGKNKKLGAGKKLADFLSFSDLSHNETKLRTAYLPGVFSADGLDEGTKLLLDTIPYENKAKVLDIACGAGIIGAIYKKNSPKSEITLSDISNIAIEATKETLRANDLQGTVLLSNGFSSINGFFDLIVTNPPFHTGVSTDYSFIEDFTAQAKNHLNKGGEIYVVANAFLPYREKLEKIGPTEIAAQTNKFIVWRTVA